MKSRIVPWILLTLAAPTPALAAPLTPAEEARVLAQARQRWQAFSSKYGGDFSRRSNVIREYDPDSGKLKKTKEIRADVFNYLFKPPHTHVVTCKVDGKKADVSDCKPRGKRKNFHHVFGKDGTKHYAVKIVARPTISGLPCHKIRVTPRKRTDGHFKGHLYLHTKDLRLVMMEGTVGKLPFPLKEFWIKLRFKEMPGHPGVGVVSSGSMKIRVKVPLFVHLKMKGTFRAWGHRLIRR